MSTLTWITLALDATAFSFFLIAAATERAHWGWGAAALLVVMHLVVPVL